MDVAFGTHLRKGCLDSSIWRSLSPVEDELRLEELLTAVIPVIHRTHRISSERSWACLRIACPAISRIGKRRTVKLVRVDHPKRTLH